MEKNKEVESMLVSALIQFLNPMQVLTKFEMIADASRPEDMILTRISCPHVISMIQKRYSDKVCRNTFLSTAVETAVSTSLV